MVLYFTLTITMQQQLFANILLCSQKIYQGLSLSYSCIATNSPTCYYSRNFISSNSIDLGVRNIAKYNSNINDSQKCNRRNSILIGPFVGVKKLINSIQINKLTTPRNSIEKFDYTFDFSQKTTSPRLQIWEDVDLEKAQIHQIDQPEENEKCCT